jgi:hypothetical protein
MAVIKGPNGQVADVDDQNRLKVFSIAEPQDKDLNTKGRSWTLQFTNTPTGAGDNFFFLRNDSTKDLFVTDIRISSSVVTEILYNHVSGTPVGGTAVTPLNRNLGNSRTPTATIEQGVDITGLTDIGVIFFEECSIANTLFHLKTTSTIIIPQGQAIAFQRVEATGLIECVVSLAEAE